jgi:hypothetical protein
MKTAIKKKGMDGVIAQVVNHKPGFNSRCHTGFLEDKAGLGQVFSKYFASLAISHSINWRVSKQSNC